MPYNQQLEKLAIPSGDDIIRRALEMVGKEADS